MVTILLESTRLPSFNPENLIVSMNSMGDGDDMTQRDVLMRISLSVMLTYVVPHLPYSRAGVVIFTHVPTSTVLSGVVR